MKTRTTFAAGIIAVVSAFMTIPAANAQGIIDGSQHGAAVGNRDAGPVGAVVGGVVGGAVGGAEGAIGLRPHHYYHHAYNDYHHRHYYR